MKVNKHPGNRIITDKIYCQSIINMHLAFQTGLTPEGEVIARREFDNFFMDELGAENYVVSNSVIKSLSFLKLKTPYDYRIFNNINERVKTYLMADGDTVRMKRTGDSLHIGVFYNETLQWVFWKADLKTGISTMQKYLQDDIEVYLDQFDDNIGYYEHKVFALMCFVFLSDIRREEMKPGAKMGNKKTGKDINDTSLKFIYVNSDWNITYVRSEGFGVSGHFALRAVGVGRTERRAVFIQPYQKKGYTRKAKKENLK